MPYVLVSSNVPASAVDVKAALLALSKAVGTALSKPEAVIMAHLSLDQHMLFAGSDAPCAMIRLRSIGRVDPEHNPTTVAALTDAVCKALNVPADRVFMNLDDVDRANWGKGGNLVLAPSST